MCYDYHCNECTHHQNDSCPSNCDGTYSVNCQSPDQNKCCCNTNFNDYTMTRKDELYPCCAPGCNYCTEPEHYLTCRECDSLTFKQPDAAFFICFANCPTGFGEDLGTMQCSGSATEIVKYDMSYITRPIVNIQTAYSAQDGLAGTAINSNFSDPLPYYLRGSYFATNAAIQIPDIRIKHSFTILMWVRFDDTTGLQTLLSIDRASYASTDEENTLDIRSNSRAIEVAVYKHRASDVGWETAQSGPSVITAATWYYLGVSLDFDGTDTAVLVYIDGSAATMDADATLTGVHLEHQDGFNTMLGCAAQSSGASASPENPFTGHMFTFKLNQTVLTSLVDDHTTSGCLGPAATCSKCPITSTDNLCLWEVGNDKREEGDGTAVDCNCTTSTTGCRRKDDCNLCFDRICAVCTNFGETDALGIDSCTACIANASFTGSAPVDTCQCDDDYFFDEATDTCAQCDTKCNLCTSVGTKVCSECNAGAFLQDNVDTCLNFCPNGYTEDGASNSCTTPPGSAKVWDLFLSKWTNDFKSVTESINNIPVTVGLVTNPSTYGTDRPWFKRSPDDRLSFLFGGDDALKIEYTDASRAGILFGHSFTLCLWIRMHNATGTQVLFSKTDITGTPTGTSADKFTFGIKTGSLFTQYVEYDAINDTYVASAQDITAAGLLDESEYTWVLAGVSYRFIHGLTYIHLTKNGNTMKSATENEQFTDLLDPTHISNVIGCQLDQSSAYGPTNFFTGDIWEVFLVNSKISGTEITSTTDNTLLPVLDTCTSGNQSGDSCSTCSETPNDAGNYIEVAVNLCSVCNSALCTQCTENADEKCTLCKAAATLTPSVEGNCICNGNTYDDQLGGCQACDGVCDTCIGPKKFQCTACNSTYNLQPDSYICADVCPTGTTASSNTCTGTISAVFIDYTFDKITKQWTYADTSVIFHAGTDATAEVGVDPLSYKLRGLFFDGTANLLTEDATKRLVLHHTMTVESWFMPYDTTGTIFSKSYLDYGSVGDSDFFDLRLADFGRIELSIKADTNQQVTAVSAGINTGSWNYIAVTILGDKLLTTTLVEGYSNGSKKTATPDTAHATLAVFEKSLSDAAIGARFDGNGSKTTANYFTGFIYHLMISSSVVIESNLNGEVETNGVACGGNCILCPSTITTCLWTCEPDEYYDGTNCTNCPSCTATPAGWDGCVRSENCGLCDDHECTDCSDFSSTATCNTCIEGTTFADCVCNANRYYNIDTHTCDACDAYCLTCIGLSNWECTVCATNNYIQDSSTFCLPFCPTGWDISGSSCARSHDMALHLDFTEVSVDLRNKAVTTANPTVNAGASQSTPVYQRGHYFNGTDMYWTLDTSTPAAVFYIHHTVTVQGWIRVMDFTAEQAIFSKNRSGTSSASAENLFFFGVRTSQKLFVTIAEGTSVKQTTESSDTLSTDWAFVAVRITYTNPNTTQRSLIKFWVNDNITAEFETTSPVWITDFANSFTTIGSELNYNGSVIYTYFFNGYMFDLKVYNMARSDSNLNAEINTGASCTGCTYCPATDCISTCAINTYGASCDPCHADCGGNCVRGGNAENCSLCDNMLCTTCEYFDSGATAACSACVTRAAVSSGTCACNEGVYEASPFGCNCATECTICTALDAYHCTECDTGYYKQGGANLCLDYCAQGYSISGQTCAGSNQRARDQFLTMSASPAANDPQPAKDRGGYFDGTNTYVDNTILLNTVGSVDAWIRPEFVSAATHMIFSRNINNNAGVGEEDNLSFYFDEAAKVLSVSFKTGTVDNASFTSDSGDALTEKVWVHVALLWDWTTDNTRIQIYKNGSNIKEDSTATVPKIDNTNWIGLIGAENNSNASAAVKASFYKGFLYEIGVSNYRITLSDFYKTSCTSYGATCSACPDSTTCLANCDLDQYPDRSKTTATCSACDASCSSGCVREHHCGLCEDTECQHCDGFTTGATCSACYPTVTQEPLSDCTCVGADMIFYSSVTNICYGCHAHCETCDVTYTRRSLYDCNTCETGFYMHQSICEDYCPTGYTTGVLVCTLTAANPFILHLTGFTSFASTMTDLQSSTVAILGETAAAYPNPDSLDPIMMQNAGIYFGGSAIMQLPPNSSTTSALLLNFEHTIEMTIKRHTDVQKDYILAKSSADGTTNKYAIGVDASGNVFMESNMSSVIVQASDSDQAVSLGAFPTDGEWHVLVITVSTSGDTSAAQTAFTAYLDGAQVGTQTISDYYFADNAAYKFNFGGRWTGAAMAGSYKGNLYDLKVYNYLRSGAQITADVLTTGGCGQCTKCYATSTCLNHCSFNQQFTESTATCQNCNVDCTYGCVRTTDCILNADPLCGSFSDQTNCLTCVDLAQTDTNNLCQCVANSTYNATSHACECNTDYQEINTGICSLCKTFLKAN